MAPARAAGSAGAGRKPETTIVVSFNFPGHNRQLPADATQGRELSLAS